MMVTVVREQFGKRLRKFKKKKVKGKRLNSSLTDEALVDVEVQRMIALEQIADANKVQAEARKKLVEAQNSMSH